MKIWAISGEAQEPGRIAIRQPGEPLLHAAHQPRRPARQGVEHQAHPQVHARQRTRPIVGSRAADQRQRVQAAAELVGTAQGEGSAAGDAQHREAAEAELIRELGEVAREVEEAGVGPVVREPEAGPIRRDHPDVAVQRRGVGESAFQARAEGAVQVEHGDAVGVAEAGEAELSAVGETHRLVDGRGVALGHEIPCGGAHAAPPALL
jgi:hypothetical protein